METKVTDNLFNKIITEKYPSLVKERVSQVQEAYKTPNHQDQKRNAPRHIIIKTLRTQNKGRILKVAKEKRQVIYKHKIARITADFSPKKVKEGHNSGPERKQRST
jgi:hypothetical protein